MQINSFNLVIEHIKHNGHIIIKDTDTGEKRTYIDYTEKEALDIYKNLHSITREKINIIRI